MRKTPLLLGKIERRDVESKRRSSERTIKIIGIKRKIGKRIKIKGGRIENQSCPSKNKVIRIINKVRRRISKKES